MKLNRFNNLKLKALLLLPAVVLMSCGENKPEEKKVEKPKVKIKVELVNPIDNQPDYILNLPGELKAFEEVVLYPKVKGFVKSIYVDRGTKVKQGQLLAVLEAPEISQQYLAAKADEHQYRENYQYSKQAYERLKKAAQKVGAVADIELDKANSKLKSDSASYNSAKAKALVSAQMLQYLKIVAPFDGVVTQKNVSAGALVGENGQPLFAIAQTNRLRLTVAIPEKHAQALNNDTKASFTVSNYPGKLFESKLSRKSDFLDQKDRSITAEFDVLNNDKGLNGGEYAQVKLLLKRNISSLWLPLSSVVFAQSETFIVKVENETVERIKVSIGNKQDNMQEVFGDITSADKIAKNASEDLLNGNKVNIVK